jgi:hypothetical protein
MSVRSNTKMERFVKTTIEIGWDAIQELMVATLEQDIRFSIDSEGPEDKELLPHLIAVLSFYTGATEEYIRKEFNCE